MELLGERRPHVQNLRPLYALLSLSLAASITAICLFVSAPHSFPRSKTLQTREAWTGRDTDIIPYGFETCRTGMSSHLAPIRVVGDFGFLSGILGYDIPCRSAIQDPRAQIHEAFRVMNYTLSSANWRLEDVVSVTSYHLNMADYLDIFVEEREAFFKKPPYPAWTAIGVASLYFKGEILELSAIARAPPCTSLECDENN